MGHQFHWEADSYLELMHSEVPDYRRLQEETAAATGGLGVRSILELGSGTGETTRRVLDEHPDGRLVGIDASEQMLAAAGRGLDAARVDLRVGHIEDPLPRGPFDLAVAALVVHHLQGERKAELFGRIHSRLRPGGRFVLADVVVPERAEDAITPLSEGLDHPSTLAEQLAWLRRAGFSPAVVWQRRDLAVVAADRPEG